MANYQRVTLSQLLDRLKERTDGVGVFWTTQEATDAINEALRVWQALTGTFTTSFIGGIEAGRVYYDVPKQICSLTRASFNGTGITQTSEVELDYGTPGWEGVTGAALYWAPIGINLAALSPQPTSGTIEWEGLQEIPSLFRSMDFINIGDEELNVILDYCQHYLAFKEGMPELASTQNLFANFVKAAGQKNARIRMTEMYKRAAGLIRDETEDPSESPNKSPGVRT